MAEHKAPTAVTIAPLEEKSAFASFVDRWWKPATLVALALTGYLLWQQKTALDAGKAESTAWSELMAKAPESPMTGLPSAESSVLVGVATDHKATSAAAWALYLAAVNAYEAKDYVAATAALDQLASEHPKHPLVVDAYSFGEGDAKVSKPLATLLRERITGVSDWRKANQDQFINPEPPADAPRIAITTDKGVIEVALYTDKAPKHAQNFLKHVNEGYYNGTKFHRIAAGFMIQGGDPNTKADSGKDASTWGQGGPDYKVDREETGLKHFEGYLAAAKMGADVQSSGSQFYITVADANHLDAGYVVFGKVTAGFNIAKDISKAELATGTMDRPAAPVTVISMAKL